MLKYAILQLLYQQPLSGYDIKKRFDTTLAFCWHATHPQIYRELHRMEKDGLVNVHVEEQNGKPNRNVYSITDLGENELKEWLKIPVEEIKYKDDLLLKIFSVHLMDQKSAHNLLAKAQELHETRLREYELLLQKMKERLFDGKRPVHNWVLGRYLDLQQGIMYEQMYLNWIQLAWTEIANHHDILYAGN